MNKHFLRRVPVLLVMLTGILALSISNPVQVQAAWLSPWLYKTPITVTNPGAALTDYQVQINLTTSNFTFSQANTDGSDIRFTALDGVTLLPFWMESWVAGTSATFWVKVPSIPGSGGSVTIYMYYGNSSATTSTSNGATTFSFFEDFEATPWTAWTKAGPGTFIQSTDRAKRGSYSGKLETTTATGSTVFSKASSLPGTNFVQEWDLYDDLDSTAFKMVRANYAIPGGQIGIGVWTGNNVNNYAFHNNGYQYTATSFARSQGWHKMAIRVTSDGSANFFVDGSASLGSLNGLPSTFNQITVEGLPDGPTIYYVDDFRVRKYASTAPTVAIGQGGGQPAVDMAVALTDSPDPVRPNQTLTYQIAVNNYGDLEATNVTVTDVLPAGVTLGTITTTQGTCSGSSPITCNLGTVPIGGSATITIQVTTPTQLGTLSNTASVSSTETDSNLANNTSTATTTVGNPIVYVVNGVDTEAFNNHPTTPLHVAFDLHNFIKGQSTYIEPLMAAGFRNANKDSFGTPFKMTWYVEMDNFINNGVYADGTPMDYLTLYNTFVSNFGAEISTWGDELANHHHFMYWNGSSWVQGGHEQAISGPYDEHNNALDRMILNAGFFPTDFRSGWLNTGNPLQAWIEKWMLADFSSNWSTSWMPYHPSTSNYLVSGSMNHWIARCDGGPNSASITAAFTEAATTGKPVIYCWYGHDRENLSGYINSLQPLLTSASVSSGVPFRYSTSKEAMQAVMGTTDTTPPTLSIAKGSGDSFDITSNEAVWNNAPYVTARYLSSTGNNLIYTHPAATVSGTNAWTVNFPDSQTINVPGVPYTITGCSVLTGAGTSCSAAYDGNNNTYWDSTPSVVPVWMQADLGASQPVRQMKVQFYNDGVRQYKYYVQSSTDGTNWSLLIPEKTVGTSGLDINTFDPATNPAATLRYARIWVTDQTGGNKYAHIREISIYQTADTSGTFNLQEVGVGAGDLVGNTAIATYIIRAMADLSLAKTSTPPSGRIGNDLTYNLTVTNHGPSPATAVQVIDTLPAGMTFKSASTGCNHVAGVVTCGLSDIANGASATASIVVTPQALGTYVNTASVTTTSTDPNQANNTASLSTVVGNPVVYVVSGVDTEPFDDHQTTPQHRPFNLTNFIRGTTTYIGPLMASGFRTTHVDSFGTPFKMTWYVEMDNYINNGVYPDGSPMDYLTLYNTFVSNYGTELATWGDELAYHHHFWAWNGTSWAQGNYEQQALDGPYDEHNNALDRMILNAGFFPTDFRSGWLSTSNQLQGWIEKWMLADFSSNWSTPWTPYHPSPTNYTQVGSMNHWIARCDGGPSQASVNSAFAEAAATGKPVIYCWYGHDRENLSGYINSLQPMLDSARASTSVPFRYATSKQAMQAVMGTTDTTPPALNVTHGSGDTFNITSSEPVWNNAPYVAARYLTTLGGFKYIHTPATLAGTNIWTAQVPATQSFTTTIQPEKYTPVGVTATHSDASYPPTLAIDGNDSTYWDSGVAYGLPQSITVDLGSVQAVAKLTVHFYDLDARTYTYNIDSSTDGTTWTPIVTTSTVHGTGTHTFDPAISMRYARVNVTDGSASKIAHIFEITLYKTATETTITETGNLQQVGVGALDLSGNSAVASNTVQALADLTLTKTATPVPAYLGSDLTYHLTITNHGPSTATAVQVTDNLPAGVTLVSATPSQGTACSTTGAITCALGDLANGASATVTIVVAPQSATTYVNTASVSAAAVDLNQADNTASVSTTVSQPMADLELTKTATPTTVKLGNNLTYTLTVTNHGPLPATSVQLTDNLPAGLTFVSSAPGQPTCTGTTTITCNLGDLANGASATVTIVVTPQAETSYTNTANVTTATLDTNQANNTASVTSRVGNPRVYVVVAIDTEADNNHPMGSLHTTFQVYNYLRTASPTCPSLLTKYSSDSGATWTAYSPTGSTVFNFEVNPAGGTTPTTGFTCGSNNAYGLDDYARAVQFTVPTTGNYDVRLQLSVTGAPPDTNIYVVPDNGGNPDTDPAHALSTYTAQAATIAGVNGQYVVIGSNLNLQAGVPYWWLANRQASGNDSNQFAVYAGSSGGTNTFSQIMDPSFRSATTDSYGHPFKMSWFMEMDNFINNGFYANGQPMNYLTLYNELMNNWGAEVRSYGDEIAYHHHFMYWDGSSWQMGGQQEAFTGPYDEHNNALDRMVLDAGFFPTDFRAGWLNNDNQMQAWIEKWMLADVGGAGWGGTGWEPYHPSATDFTQVGSMNHWMANCPGGPSQDSVNSAFAQAIADNRPVILCWYMHERDDMRGLVNAANGYLHTAASANPGVPFIYATAKEAMQAVIGTTDTTSPLLTVTPTGADNYRINSNETLWGSAPYVAARYGEGTGAAYVHLAATPAGANTWTVNVPSTNATLPLSQVGTGAIDLSGNSAVANLTNLHAPVAVADSYTTNQNTTLTVSALLGVLANDTDQDGNPLTAIKLVDPLHGALTLNSDGSFTYIPAPGYSGSDSFTYKANDGLQDSGPATVTIQVTPTGIPILPSSFYGEIHFANPPAENDVIEAHVPGINGPAATTTVHEGSPPYYSSFDVPGDDPTTSLIKEGGAENDLITFILNGRTVATATWHAGTNTRLDFNSTAVHMLQGWNLVSFNLVPANSAIADVLFSLGTNYDLVYAWDASGVTSGNWMMFDPTGPAYGNSLTALNEKMGFWIHMTVAATLDVAGSLPVGSTEITLATGAGGWNLVGFPAAAGRDLPGAIPTQASLVYAYHLGETDPWLMFDRTAPAWVNDLSALTPGWGYWVKVTAPVTWSVPYP